MTNQTLITGATVLLLLMVAVLGIIVLWRRRAEHYLGAQLAAEQERREVAERYEEALRRNESVLLEAQRMAELGNWEWNLATGALTWSEQVYRIFGRELSLGPANFEEVSRYFTPGGWEQLRVAVGEAISNGTPYSVEVEIIRDDGSSGWVITRGEATRNSDGIAVELRGMIQNVTARRQAEQRMAEEAVRRRILIEKSRDGIVVLAEDGSVTEANESFAAMLRYSREEVLQLHVWDWDAQWDREQLLERIRGVEEEGERIETLHRRKDGTCFAVEISTNGARVGGQKLLFCVCRDVSRRKQAEEQLRKLSLAVEQSPAAVLITDPTGAIEYVNAKFTELTGYGPEEILGRNPRILKSGETPDEIYRELWRTIRAGGEWRGEFHNRRKNGELFWESAFISPIVDQGRVTHFVGIKEDITQRKRMEQERESIEVQLRQQQKLESLGTLASGVAHEINNPINGIMNYAQLIQDQLPSDSPLTELTGEILVETQRVADIVRNLLTFARAEKQHYSPAHIEDILEATLSLVRTIIRHDQITLEVAVTPGLPKVKCRSQQIQQVLMNLMTNARDALNEKFPGHDPGKRMHLQARLIEEHERRRLRVTVEDHGTGIEPGLQERIFDPFFTTKGRDKGTGLGLSISHGIVKEHGGALTIESELGRWTRVHMELPIDPDPLSGDSDIQAYAPRTDSR